MSTALELLRTCFVQGKATSLEGDVLVLDGLRVPRATQTNYKSTTGAYYPLDVVWYFYEKREMDPAAYMQAARQENIGFVSRVDRLDLENYLAGEIVSSNKIDTAFQGDKDWLDLVSGTAAAAKSTTGSSKKRPADEQHKDKTGPTKSASSASSSSAAKGPDAAAAAKRQRTEKSSSRVTFSEETKKLDEAAAVSAAEAIANLVNHERRLRDRTTVLLCDKSFSFVTNVLKEAESKSASSSVVPPSSSSSTVSAAAKAPSSKPASVAAANSSSRPSSGRKSSAPTPIIIVPGSSSVITLANVKEFLEASSFVDPVEKAKLIVTKDKEILVQRSNAPEGQPKVFRVIDMPKRLKPEEWSNVICVFVNGREWQLKDYLEKWKTSAEVFSKVMGVHVKYVDEKQEDVIKNWNVTVLQVDRFKRHLDATILEKFWSKLDHWITMHRPNLY